MNYISVAIDGPSGAGKSTLARRAAKKLGYLYLDTGAIYRTVGYHMSIMGISPKDEDGIRLCVDDVNIDIAFGEDGVQHMLLNGADVSEQIRTPQMSAMASAVAAYPCVRQCLLETQRSFARTHNVIMDGRDIGTVVLPDADVKIYLTASPEVRAQRRYEEMLKKGQKVEYAEVLADMKQRDYQDVHREIAPLTKASDAVELDTTGLSLEQCVAAIVEIIGKKTAK